YAITVSTHGFFSFFPVCRTNLSEVLNVCISINQTKVFFHVSSQRHIVYAFVENLTIFVNQVGCTVSNVRTLDDHGVKLFVVFSLLNIQNTQNVRKVTGSTG